MFGEAAGRVGDVLARRHTAQRALRNFVHAFQREFRDFREILLESDLHRPHVEVVKVKLLPGGLTRSDFSSKRKQQKNQPPHFNDVSERKI